MSVGGGLPTFNRVPLEFGLTMALIDTSMLSLIKYISTHKGYLGWIVVPMIVYMCQPVLFYFSLQYETLTVMNLLWDVISDLLITTMGLLVFKETIGPYKKAGVIFSLLSIVLLSLNDGL